MTRGQGCGGGGGSISQATAGSVLGAFGDSEVRMVWQVGVKERATTDDERWFLDRRNVDYRDAEYLSEIRRR